MDDSVENWKSLIKTPGLQVVISCSTSQYHNQRFQDSPNTIYCGPPPLSISYQFLYISHVINVLWFIFHIRRIAFTIERQLKGVFTFKPHGSELFNVTATDRRQGKIKLQFRYLFGNPGGEGVAVGAWKSLIGRFPGIGVGGFVDSVNQFVNTISAVRFQNPWFISIPIPIGSILRDFQYRPPAISAPTNNVVYCVCGFVGPLGCNPANRDGVSMKAEIWFELWNFWHRCH